MTEVKPTEDRSAGKLIRWPDTANIGVTEDNGEIVWWAQISTLNPNTSIADLRNVAGRIVTACNAYEPMREALLSAKQFITNGIEFGFIRMPDRDDPAHNTLPMILAALSTLPVNDRQTSDDVGILREALAETIGSLEFARTLLEEYEEAASHETFNSPRINCAIEDGRAALKGVPQPASEAGKLSTDEVRE